MAYFEQFFPNFIFMEFKILETENLKFIFNHISDLLLFSTLKMKIWTWIDMKDFMNIHLVGSFCLNLAKFWKFAKWLRIFLEKSELFVMIQTAICVKTCFHIKEKNTLNHFPLNCNFLSIIGLQIAKTINKLKVYMLKRSLKTTVNNNAWL